MSPCRGFLGEQFRELIAASDACAAKATRALITRGDQCVPGFSVCSRHLYIMCNYTDGVANGLILAQAVLEAMTEIRRRYPRSHSRFQNA